VNPAGNTAPEQHQRVRRQRPDRPGDDVEDVVALVVLEPSGAAAATGRGERKRREVGDDVARAHDPGAGGGEFDGKGEIADCLAKAVDVGVIEVGAASLHRASPIEGDGVRAGERIHAVDGLGPVAERDAAGGQHRRAVSCRDEHVGDIDGSVANVFAVVQHHEAVSR
jgi:hypothetical protein